MSNKPRFPFGGSNRGDEDDDDDEKGRPSGGGSRLPNPLNRGTSPNKPDDKRKDDRPGASKPGSSAFGSRSPFGRKDDDIDDDEDELEDKPGQSSGRAGSFGSNIGSRSPFGRKDDDDVEDEDEEDSPPSRSSFGSKPSSSFGSKPGGGSSFGAKPGGSGSSSGSSFGNKPNEPAKPNSPFGGKPGGSGSSSGSSFGNKPNEPAKSNPFGSKPGGSGSSSGSSFGNKPNEPAKPNSPFGAKPGGSGSSSGSSFGNKPNEPAKPNSPFGAKPGGSGSSSGSSFGNKPNEPAKPNSPFGAKSGTSTPASAGKPGSSFGAKPADKPAGGGLFGAKLPFGNKPADKKDDRPAAGGIGSRLPFGNKPADKKDDRPAAGGGIGSRLPFGNKPADKPTDKPAGGLLGGRLPFGAKSGDKPDDKAAARPGAPFGAKPAGPSLPTGRPSAAAVATPPKAAGAADIKKPGSKTPPARGEKVAKPLERGKQIQVQHGLSLDQKLDLLGYALIFSGALMFFAIISPTEGTITKGIADFLGGFVGRIGLIPVAISSAAIGLWLFIRHFNENPLVIQAHRAAGYALMFIAFITTAHAIEMLNHPVANMQGLIRVSDALVKLPTHPGGGWLGGTIYKALIGVSGEIGVWVILVGFWLVSLMLSFSITLAEISAYIKSVFQWFARVRRSYLDHRAASAQAKAAAAPLTIESPSPVGVGATPAAATLGAGPTPNKKGIPIPERTGVQASVGAPRLAPATAPAASPAAASKPAASSPFGKAPAQAVRNEDVDDDELEKSATPVPTRPAPLGTSAVSTPVAKPATPAAKPSPFGARPAANVNSAPDVEDEELDDDELKDAAPAPIVKPNPVAPARPGGSPFGNRPQPNASAQPAEKTEDTKTGNGQGDKVAESKPATPIGSRSSFGQPSAQPAPFGSKPAEQSAPAAKSSEKVDDSDNDLDDEKVAEAKPATPIGNRNPFGQPSAQLASAAKPVEKADEDSDDDLADDKVAEAKPATPIGNRPNPFGSRPGGNPFGSKPASPAKDEDDDLDENDAADARPAASSRPNPFGSAPNAAPKPGGNPFGARPPVGQTASTAKPADEDDDLDAENDEPATPIGNRPNPFGARPGGSPFGTKPPQSGVVVKSPDEDKATDLEKVDEKPTGAQPAAPSRPNPFGSAPNAAPKPGGNPFGTRPPVGQVSPTTKPVDRAEETAVPTAEDMKPATPIGNRPPDSTPTAAMPRPVPKPGLATRPQFEDDEQDDEPKYVPVDDTDVDAPPSNGPRPTVAGNVNTPPAAMPRPAAPITPRPRPGEDQAKPATPASPFGRPPMASSAPAAPSNNANGVAPVQNAPAAKPQEATPAPAAPPLEGVIVRSKGGQNGTVPDYRELLESGSQQKINDQVLQERAKIIEETLNSFSAPGRVVEINPGPVITQFGVEPDYLTLRQGKKIRVKVSQIAKLDADLALALSARSIRIEAPVPGKGYVGIEVPNAETSLVSLRDIMDSEEFQHINSKLRIGLGQSVDGAPIAADLTQMPHLLIAGTTGSGKSVCVNAIITCLLLQNSPDDMKMIMVDPKRVELTGYNGIPHLVSPVVVDLERIVGVLKWVTREMDERYKKFSAAGARNILDYNGRLGASEPRLPYLVVVIDELADLMMLAPDETEKVLTRLAQMARATGIHLIISTQRPSVDVVTGLIKANFPARISFAVASSVDSRVVLDQPGAEKLLGRGDMLYQAPDAAAPLRMQGVYVSDAAINRVTRYWKGITTEAVKPAGTPASALSSPVDFNRPAEPVQSRAERFGTSTPDNGSALSQRVFGSPMATGSNGDSNSEDDEMYEEALELVKRAGKPSIQMLQRRLRIGYTRAARLIELMEKRGAISSADARNASTSGDVPDEGDDPADKP